MIMMTTPSLVVLLTIILYSIQPSAEAANLCLGDSVPEGSQSEVTCFFDEDIKQNRLAYHIWKFPLNSDSLNNTNGTEVLYCSWGQTDIPNCMVEKGYALTTNSVGCKVTLKIPSMTMDQEGIYKCQLVTQNDVPYKTCTVQIYKPARHGKDRPLHPVIGALGPVGTVAITAVVAPLLLLGVVIILVTAFCYWHKYKKARNANEDIEEQNEFLETEKVRLQTEVQALKNQTQKTDTGDRGINTDIVERCDKESNTLIVCVKVGDPRNLGSTASIASIRSQQENPKKKRGKGSVENLPNSPANPVSTGQSSFDETEEDMDASLSLFPQNGGHDSFRYTQSPDDDDGQGEDTTFYAEEDGRRGENEKTSGKKKGIFSSFRSLKTRGSKD